eukprot:TRINITY_DN8143_c0_g1_i1.p1 TRINITY_DN8143_c0_g1~~TRINITY_DN8143_c0_g1_i1.p1  ORF type:complete len:394 (-),score=74.15 TRINITY_DN8143_c0_g1_i1:101-1282(-)
MAYVETLGWRTMLGVGLVLLGSTIDNVGLTLQKLAHLANAKTGHETAYYKKGKWLMGISLFMFGNIINAVGLSMCPQSLFAALGAYSLVVNVLTSKFIVKEKLTPMVLLGTVIIIIGSVVAVIFGSHESTEYDLNLLMNNLKETAFICYLATLISAIFLLHFAIRQLHNTHNIRTPTLVEVSDTVAARGGRSEAISLDNSIGAGSSASELGASAVRKIKSPEEQFAFSFDEERVVGQVLISDRAKIALCIAYPTLSGMIGSMTLLSAKIASELVKSTIRGSNEFGKFETYIFLFFVCVLGPTQVHVLNLGLKYFDQLVIIPTFSVALEIFSIAISIVFFKEASRFDPVQAVVFPLAILVTCTGVYVTAEAQRRQRNVSKAMLLSSSPKYFDQL